MALTTILLLLLPLFVLAPFIFRLVFRLLGSYLIHRTASRRQLLLPNGGNIIAFFHPFCNAGGGGERVLWAAIRATQDRWPDAVCIVYTGDHDAEKNTIIDRVRDRFNIRLDRNTLHFMYLNTRHWVLPSTYPYFTLLGQSLGSLVLAVDAFNLIVPDIYIDTMGFAFTIALSKLLFPHVPTAAYVHYPTISTDMLQSLDADADSGKGLNAGAGDGWKGQAKRKYWKLFAALYSWTGSSVDVVMTNSSWTKEHIQELWGPSRQKVKSIQKDDQEIAVIFPPVAVAELDDKIPLSAASEMLRQRHLLYIAQFRPEKNHALIIDAFSELLKSREWPAGQRPSLILLGSVRDGEDKLRVYKFRLQVHALQMKSDVVFVLNASWPRVLDRLQSSSIGVNGMWNEHFGIGVVEYQAAGLISVVNDSGGPKRDIVVEVGGQQTGFHASTASEYAAAFARALDLSPTDTLAMRKRARESARRFSEKKFATRWVEQMEKLVKLQKGKKR
ncbi:alpha-mannosyltransferase [Microthyrium microscopicum]|uniref:GDP-Man:Man(3)GlcNAc(2)-PP-Dol alpha-1,2-mannosyltransferase n=1 Tax=Microthyrium microscopicum TaxID=703497 RepID=A0A6A6US30_9PEZI|nr:alpha-mannosyltransferase [Microthyrium microscopicum]